MKIRVLPSVTLNTQSSNKLKQQHVNFNNFATSWRAKNEITEDRAVGGWREKLIFRRWIVKFGL